MHSLAHTLKTPKSHLPALGWLAAAVVALAGGIAPAAAGGLAVHVVDSAGKAIAEAAVYVMPRGNTRTPKRPAPTPAMVEQLAGQFKPLVTVVQTGSRVSFPNHDGMKHHVYSFSLAKTFEIKLYSGNTAAPVVFDKPGIVSLGCNIHDWMEAYIAVVDTPYFGKTNQGGDVRITGVPPGEYEIRAWHPDQRTELAAQPITLKSQALTSLTLALPMAPKQRARITE